MNTKQIDQKGVQLVPSGTLIPKTQQKYYRTKVQHFDNIIFDVNSGIISMDKTSYNPNNEIDTYNFNCYRKCNEGVIFFLISIENRNVKRKQKSELLMLLQDCRDLNPRFRISSLEF